MRPLDDPLELEPDDPEDPDDPDEPEDDPEPDVRDEEPLLDVPLDEPDVYPTPLITLPCCVSAPRTTTTGAP